MPRRVNGQSTRSVHAGVNRNKPKHALIDPIFHTSTFTFDNVSDIKEYLELKEAGIKGERVDYGRYGNPTVRGVEVRIAELENAEDALLFASGMAALTTTLLTFLSTGDHLIITDDCYRQTRNFVLTLLKRFGVECTMVPMDDFEAIEAAIQPNTKLIVSETPTNPYLRVLDLSKLVSVVKPKGIMTVIDTTFASPINLRALGFGIDLVIHSATKYLGGHNDLLGWRFGGEERINRPGARKLRCFGRNYRSKHRLFIGKRIENTQRSSKTAEPKRTDNGRIPGQASGRRGSMVPPAYLLIRIMPSLNNT